MKKLIIVLGAMIAAVLPNALPASALTCELGYGPNLATGTCSPVWLDWSSNDGFTKYAQLGVVSSNSDYRSGIPVKYYLDIICSSKRLHVHVYSDPLGIYADSNMYGNGSGQVKFDNQKPSSFKYERDDNMDGVWVSNVDAFIKKFMKAKSTVSFKISGIDGPAIATFPKTDFIYGVSSLRERGCKV